VQFGVGLKLSLDQVPASAAVLRAVSDPDAFCWGSGVVGRQLNSPGEVVLLVFLGSRSVSRSSSRDRSALLTEPCGVMRPRGVCCFGRTSGAAMLAESPYSWLAPGILAGAPPAWSSRGGWSAAWALRKRERPGGVPLCPPSRRRSNLHRAGGDNWFKSSNSRGRCAAKSVPPVC